MVTSKNLKIIYITIIILVFAIAAIFVYVTHTPGNTINVFLYIASLAFLSLGIINFTKGRKRLREVRAQGEQTTWYKQPQMDSGIALLLFGLFVLLEPFANHLPNVIGDRVSSVMFVVLALLAFPFVFLAFKYRASIQNTKGSP